MTGHWQLQHLGTETWQANGTVNLKSGIASSGRLLVNGSLGQAELKGSYEISKQRGNVDIIAGNLDWNPTDSPDKFWQSISLNGHIQHTELTLLDNHWYEIQSGYSLAEGKLILKELQSILADGSFTSKTLMFAPASDKSTADESPAHAGNGLGIQGYIRAENIQLHKIRRLSDWLQADISGQLHANIKLAGNLAQTSVTAWQHSNGDILIYNGRWEKQMKSESLTERPGIKTPTFKPYAFSKLGFRFHINGGIVDISKLKLVHRHQQYLGKASIMPNLHVQGRVKNSADSTGYLIDSTQPEINWQLQQTTTVNKSPEKVVQ